METDELMTAIATALKVQPEDEIETYMEPAVMEGFATLVNRGEKAVMLAFVSGSCIGSYVLTREKAITLGEFLISSAGKLPPEKKIEIVKGGLN